MKKYIKYLILLFIILNQSCLTTGNNKSADSCNQIYDQIEDLFSGNGWFFDKTGTSKAFEEIYNNNSKSISDCLITFSEKNKNVEITYWIGIFLYEEYYTKIKNYDLAFAILQNGLKNCTEESQKISLLYIMGHILWKQDKKKSKTVFP